MAIDLTRLRTLFLEEFEEHRATLQDGLLELGREPAAADRMLPELFRAAHSLKGGAHAVQLPAVAAVCHRLEEAFSGLRDGTVALTAELHGSLLDDVDTLVDLAAEVRREQVDTPPPDDASPPASSASSTLPTPPGPPRRRTRPALRVPAERLDALLDRAGDVLLARDRLARLARDSQELADAASVLDRRWQEVRPQVADGIAPRPAAAIAAADRAWQGTGGRIETLRAHATEAARTLNAAAAGLEHSTRTLRLQPFRLACDGLERAVRDLAHAPHSAGTRATVVVEDRDVELDGEVVTALRDPLLHLVRNAVAHGIEPPDVRRSAGKPETGTVTVTAHVLGDQVEVRVADDGAGLDAEALRTIAERRGIEVADGDDAIAGLVWLPGLSTAETTDDLAGRGVGLDAVRGRVEQLGGAVELTSTTGRGCVVTLHVPVTLTTLYALIVTVGDETLALPSAALRRVVRIPAAELNTTGGAPYATVDGQPVAVVSLRTFVGLSAEAARDHHLAVVVTGANGLAALLVDDVAGTRRITRRQLHPRLDGAPGVLGTTLLPTGDVAFVLNPATCVAAQLGGEAVPLFADDAATATRAPRVLLAEDTATTRALEQGILERAGYDVRVAVDGVDAWRSLREHGADLVVTDIEMPGMDGFALCQAIREHPRLGDLPVVLVTSHASDEDRHRGIEVGANAYLVKGRFDQAAFLATIGRLL